MHNVIPRNTPRPLPARFVGRTKCQDLSAIPELMTKHGVTVTHKVWFADDGWFDGVDSLHAIVEDKSGRLHTVKLGDSGRWFVRGYGWSLIFGDLVDEKAFDPT